MDRNCYLDNIEITQAVALRKESVDRNLILPLSGALCCLVALRKESVDRNKRFKPAEQTKTCRSPQGERG